MTSSLNYVLQTSSAIHASHFTHHQLRSINSRARFTFAGFWWKPLWPPLGSSINCTTVPPYCLTHSLLRRIAGQPFWSGIGSFPPQYITHFDPPNGLRGPIFLSII